MKKLASIFNYFSFKNTITGKSFILRIALGISIPLLILNFYSSSNTTITPTTLSKFFEYVVNDDVEKIEVINKKKIKIYLTAEAELKSIHKNTVKSSLLPMVSRNPNYKAEFGDFENFKNYLSKLIYENNLNIGIEYIENHKPEPKNIINKNFEIIFGGLALVVFFFILATYYKRISALFERKKYIVFSICLLLLVLGVFYFQSQNSVINGLNFIIILILTFKNSKP